MPRRFLIALLAFGTVAGFGSGFASVAHHLRGDYGGYGCHAQYGGGWGWNRGQPAPMNASPAPFAAQAPAAAPTAPIPVAAPVAAPAPAPYAQPIIVVPQGVQPQAQQGVQLPPINVNVTVTPNGQVRTTTSAAPQSATPAQP